MIVTEEEGGAIGGRSLQSLGGDLAAGARLVLDDHRHAQDVLELVGQRTGDGIGAAPGRKAHQDADGIARLAPGGCASASQGQGGQQAAAHARGGSLHESLQVVGWFGIRGFNRENTGSYPNPTARKPVCADS